MRTGTSNIGGLLRHCYLVFSATQDEVPADPNKIHLPKFVGHT